LLELALVKAPDPICRVAQRLTRLRVETIKCRLEIRRFNTQIPGIRNFYSIKLPGLPQYSCIAPRSYISENIRDRIDDTAINTGFITG